MTDRPSKVLIVGSGPIIIGQAAEFDYAGTQACKAMREEGVTSVLVNSNPATIMTDEDIADVVYIEPLTVPVIERIIAREQPDGLIPTLGGQTGLNLAVALADAGVLAKYNVRLLGTPLSAIQKAEDRELFRQTMTEIGEPIPASKTVNSVQEAEAFVAEIGLPAVIRPAYTLGGTGGGIAHTPDELRTVVSGGLSASPITQVLVEEYLLGWKEIEYEVMRDSADNCITVCNMENIDPMGVHTGDSIVIAPSQTLSDREYQMLRTASLNIIRSLGIEGGCNVQLALDPHSFAYRVIEVNPRVSRSSALASKATGYPIARMAAKIAIGRTLDKLPNPITEKTTAAFEPALDYVVVKIPRWPFDKFPSGDRVLGTQMKSTGEVMAIDRTLEAALQKAVRGLEIGDRSLMWEDEQWQRDPEAVWQHITEASDLRLWAIMSALRRGTTVEELARRSHIDTFFLQKFAGIRDMEQRLLTDSLTPGLLWEAKRLGFADSQIGTLADVLPARVREMRKQWGIVPVYKMVDTCAAEFEAQTPYFYSTYELENDAPTLTAERAAVVGSGPIRIGQGIEFDYCSVHAAWALASAGVQSIMVNSNPETVSTDFDTSDRLYFEPLDTESVLNVLDNEGVPPTIVQFGGQTAINLAEPLTLENVALAGSGVSAIDLAEDRRKFEAFLDRLGIPQPPGAAVTNVEDALSIASNIGYPVLVRPSYVLGGRAMEIVNTPEDLKSYVATAVQLSTRHPVLVDKYLQGKEVEVDAICDGKDVLIPGIMEHIERAGVHSGDSFAVYPPRDLHAHTEQTIVDYTTRICLELGVLGLVNIQYVIFQDEVFVLEVNPRSSRTVPFLSKVTDVPMVRLATLTMLGKTLVEMGYKGGLWPKQPLVAVKAPVFSMAKLRGVETSVGPEMKSTGEVMGVDVTFEAALYKAMVASGLNVPAGGTFLLSIADADKDAIRPIVRQLAAAGYNFMATEGTASMLDSMGIPVRMISKRLQGTPNVVSVIRDGEVQAVINSLTGGRAVLQDGFFIRRAAVELQIPCLTSLDTSRALATALSLQQDAYLVQPLCAYRDDR
ncbi:MAG: carbamoyl-phosphate synthase large subunit [Chloroflexota bacterium]|nr:carbamoyl-phosphate synthase large subunit [Chloroflexota bacterium]